MQFQLPIQLESPSWQICYRDKILLIGSCFTEHIGDALEELKITVLQNPNGILFDPLSVCRSLVSYIHDKKYSKADLFELNEVWHSWEHHSRFSSTNAEEAMKLINESQAHACQFMKEADWVIITLGTSFSYELTDQAIKTAGFFDNSSFGGLGVANCHRAPAQWFKKRLLEITEIISMLDHCYHQIIEFNPKLKILLTVSPVRHIRDGVIENNRSKARLIEAVHTIANKHDGIFYFPAYELVIDVLRDYRFFDIDLVHPNYQATEFVLSNFIQTCIDERDRDLMEEIKKINIARKHKAFHPETNAHRQFMASYLEKTKSLLEKYPFLDLKEELVYFSQT